MSRGFESSCLPEHVRKLLPVEAKTDLGKLGARLTPLSPEQAAYIGVPLEGPYKPDHYRY